MAEGSVVLPAYVDEAGSRGLVRNLSSDQDHEFGLMCALLFDPDQHAQAIQDFTPAFEKFRGSAPPGAKLHITDAFKPGNEAWRAVAEPVREEYLHLIHRFRPMVIYTARRLKIARIMHERTQDLQDQAKKARRSPVKIVGENRPSDARIEDDLVLSLALRLDGFADSMARQIYDVQQVDLLFDEIDLAERYEASIQRTREISGNITNVKGFDPTQSKRLQGSIEINVSAPFRIDTKFIGAIHVVGKAHPLVLAADIVANYLAHHLSKLPADAPLNAPSSIDGWVLSERVWGVMDKASEDLL